MRKYNIQCKHIERIKNFAFITLFSSEKASDAIFKLNGLQIKNTTITCSEYIDKQNDKGYQLSIFPIPYEWDWQRVKNWVNQHGERVSFVFFPPSNNPQSSQVNFLL